MQTVESGKMTKDLALLVGPEQPWQSTEEFLASIDEQPQAGDGMNRPAAINPTVTPRTTQEMNL